MTRLKVLPVLAMASAALIFGCSDEPEETLPQGGSGSPVATATGSPSAATVADSPTPADPPVTPEPTPAGTAAETPTSTAVSESPTDAPVQTYSHPSAGYSFDYPAGWSLEDYPGEPQSRVASFELLGWMSSRYPPSGVLVDAVRLPLDQVDPRPTGSADASLGTVPGWISRADGGPDAPWAKVVGYSADSEAYRYSLTFFFADLNADESIAHSIAASFAAVQ